MAERKVRKKAVQLELPLGLPPQTGPFADEDCPKCGKTIVTDWSLMPAFAKIDMTKICSCKNGS
jgi:hypothetical protein